MVIFEVRCTCLLATPEAEFRDGVDSITVGANSLLIDG